MDRASEIPDVGAAQADDERQPSLPRDKENKAFFILIAEVKRLLSDLENKVGPTAEESRALAAGRAHSDLDEPRSIAVIFEDVYTFDEDKKRREIEERTDEIQKLIEHAKQKLSEIDADAKDGKKDYTVADRKMRTNMHTTLAKRTETLAAKFLELKTDYRKQNEDAMLRQVKITVPDTNQATGEAYTDKELELMAAECLETGTSPYLAALAASTLEDVLRKHEAIKKLERDVELVAEMFQDLATLVSAQGEELDRIEDHVTKAFADAKKGVTELKKANDHARKNRKRMCCLWWCLVLALVAILFPLLASSIFGA